MQQGAGQGLHLLLIGMEVRDLIPFVQDAQEVPSHIRFHRADADGLFHGIRHGHFLQVVGGKVHLQQVPLPGDGEDAAHGVEGHHVPVLLVEVQDRKGGGQSGVPAQIDLSAGSEPPQVIPLSFLHREGGLGEVVLNGDALHGLLRDPLLHDAHGGRISREDVIGKGIHDILDHGHFSVS